jgi:hypothetical protein
MNSLATTFSSLRGLHSLVKRVRHPERRPSFVARSAVGTAKQESSGQIQWIVVWAGKARLAGAADSEGFAASVLGFLGMGAKTWSVAERAAG